MSSLRTLALATCAGAAILACALNGLLPTKTYQLLGDADTADAARHIVATSSACRCYNPDLSEDASNTLLALMLVEQAANSGLWRAGKAIVLKVSLMLGLSPPNLTYGPMMIRLSRFRQFSEDADLRILDQCSAFLIARRIVEADTGIQLSATSRLSRNELLLVAARYNGQHAWSAKPDKVLADSIYNQLVYSVAQELRFRSLRQRAVEMC